MPRRIETLAFFEEAAANPADTVKTIHIYTALAGEEMAAFFKENTHLWQAPDLIVDPRPFSMVLDEQPVTIDMLADWYQDNRDTLVVVTNPDDEATLREQNVLALCMDPADLNTLDHTRTRIQEFVCGR